MKQNGRRPMPTTRIYTMLCAMLTLMSAAVASARDVRTLPELEVWGKRPLKDVGVEKTEFDSLALKENVALSMADILTYHSSVFVKNYGRATLSTVAFRGTSPSHTQVTWNGMRINSPMLGMTDFSTIPSFLVDKASLLHGSSSVGLTGGALGGAVQLTSVPETGDTTRHRLRFVQGVGSYRTFDDFVGYTFSTDRLTLSTRLVYSSSANDYKYINHDKKENIYDESHNIVGQYYPVEKNRSGAFRDFHVMEQIYYRPSHNDRLGADVWYFDSNRELPLLTTDYGDERGFDNRQRERTFRAVLSWYRYMRRVALNAGVGYTYTQMHYDYKRETAPDVWSVMTRSRSFVNTVSLRADLSWYIAPKLMMNFGLAGYQHFVKSKDKTIIRTDGFNDIVGYDKARVEVSGVASAKWQPVEPVGLSLTLREELFGDKTAFIPAFFADALLWRPFNVMFKGSLSANHKFPSLNDMYFLPGGNPDLRDEKGLTYDLGLGASRASLQPFGIVWSVSANWFDSYIDDWIIWLPTTKGFFSPRNVRKVHAYGIEANFNIDLQPSTDWLLSLNASYTWSPSVNRGEPLTDADRSVGKQLPYVPLHSASATLGLAWKSWRLLYKWASYSRRYTMTSNDHTLTGYLPSYYMNNVALQKDLAFRRVDLQLKLAVNNLFNEDYLSVSGHPMPGINFEFFITVVPKF